jgi:hypothetical protein
MSIKHVAGWLNVSDRNFGGYPDQGLPGGGGSPDQGLPGGGEYPDQGLPGLPPRPTHPIVIPPLVGVWPPPGTPTHPIHLPPEISIGVPSHPIYIQGTPEHPIALPPGSIWPPLPPSEVGGSKTAILIWVVGVGARWYVYDPPQINPMPPVPPGEATPKY